MKFSIRNVIFFPDSLKVFSCSGNFVNFGIKIDVKIPVVIPVKQRSPKSNFHVLIHVPNPVFVILMGEFDENLKIYFLRFIRKFFNPKKFSNPQKNFFTIKTFLGFENF